MVNIIRWSGGPGSGKTRQLVEYLKGEVEAGTPVHDITPMTFSKTQAGDFAHRIEEALPDEDPKTISQQCRTIHSTVLKSCIAAGLIDIRKDGPHKIIEPGNQGKETRKAYESFMKEHHLPYAATHRTEEGDEVDKKNLGNQLIALNAYLTATMLPPARWRTAAFEIGASLHTFRSIPDLLYEWNEYKTRNGYYEHEDYIRLAIERELPPPSPVLIIDEYQDVSPAQAKIIKMWLDSPDCTRVYIAGDPDQAIYGFRGASPQLMKDLQAIDQGADDHTRPTSHRCPVKVMQAAEMVLRHQANVSPKGEDGYISHSFIPTPVQLATKIEVAYQYGTERSHEPVFILTRFNRNVKALCSALAAEGIPFSHLKNTPNQYWGIRNLSGNDEVTGKVNIWHLTRSLSRMETASEIDPVPEDEAVAIITATTTGNQQTNALSKIKQKVKQAAGIRAGDLFPYIGEPKTAIRRVNLSDKLKRQIAACIHAEKKRGYIIHPERVKVDSIHASKGLQASVVVLHTAYLKKRLDDIAIPDKQAEERRVYYVGLTRASEAVALIDYGKAPVCPLVMGVGY